MKLEEHFAEAPHLIVTNPERERSKDGWLSARKYPPELKPEAHELGMVVESGKIIWRVFQA